MSTYGQWTEENDLPAFVYDADHTSLPQAEWDPLIGDRTRRHWVALGNRRIQIIADNDGGVGLWDTFDGARWLTAPEPSGTGISVVTEADGAQWGSAFHQRSQGADVHRVFGPTSFSVRTAHEGLSLRRTVWCLDGEQPWILIEVRLALDAGGPHRAVQLTESWTVRPRFSNLGTPADARKDIANQAVRYHVTCEGPSIRAVERRTPAAAALQSQARPSVLGHPVAMMLCACGGTPAAAVGPVPDAAEPRLELVADVAVAAGEQRTLWFRFGIDDGEDVADPQSLVDRSLKNLQTRLPRAHAPLAPMAEREVPWHAALLTGGACADGVIGGHTLDQSSAYAFCMGFNGAARDPLQHALPLVYSEPDLALSVLRNTLAWATPAGDLPYALDGAKHPWTARWQPSDQNLWALWLAAEYAAATGDSASFAAMLDYHPVHQAPAVPLGEHLRRQFRFFVDEIGLGEHGHVRIRNADWNDFVLDEPGADRDRMIEAGESVLNSAMAAWVLPVYAGLCDRLGDHDLAAEARVLGERLRVAVADEWNGRWFRRAYGPGVGAIGERDCWLEVQPWAVICGAAGDARAAQLLLTIDDLLRTDSPLGARLRWPVDDRMTPGGQGEGTGGGIWPSINMTLIWAATKVWPDMAWDEWRRMSLSAHTEAYPDIWEGTLSGPDSYNSPESPRPGRTWSLPDGGAAMQAFPVNNLHSHAQPLLAYLRLLGVEPTPEGALRTGKGATFSSATFSLAADGSGTLRALGDVTLISARGATRGGRGQVSWQ